MQGKAAMKMKIKKFVSAITLAGAVLSCATSASAQQDYPNIIKRLPADQAFQRADDALKVGDFIFKPTIGFTEYYDSNIFATQTNEASDSISSINTSLALDSAWKVHALAFELGINASRYAEYDTENSVDNWLTARGDYDITRNSQLFAGASYIRDHEERSSPNEVYGIEPTEFNETRINAGYRQKINQHSLTLAINSNKYDFTDVASSIGTIDNDTRDYTELTPGLRFNYALSQNYFLFAQTSTNSRDYEQPLDGNGYNRDSNGTAYAIGFKFNRNNLLQGEAFVGHIRQNFDDTRFDTISAADFGTQVRWFTSPDTALNLTIDRSLEETTLDGASILLYTQYALRADHRFSAAWFCNLSASRGDADYQMLSREDTYSDFGIGVSYALVEGLTFDADFRTMKRDASTATDTYNRNQILLSVSAHL